MMTKREFLNAIVNGLMSDDTVAFAQAEIAKMDAANEKRRTAEKKPNAELAARVGSVLAVLTDELMTADELVEAVGEVKYLDKDGKELTAPITAGQVRAAVKVLIADGVAVKGDKKIEGVKGAKVGYALAPKAE